MVHVARHVAREIGVLDAGLEIEPGVIVIHDGAPFAGRVGSIAARSTAWAANAKRLRRRCMASAQIFAEFDGVVGIAGLAIEPRRAGVSRKHADHDERKALASRPILAGSDQRAADTLSAHGFDDEQLEDVGVAPFLRHDEHLTRISADDAPAERRTVLAFRNEEAPAML